MTSSDVVWYVLMPFVGFCAGYTFGFRAIIGMVVFTAIIMLLSPNANGSINSPAVVAGR